jgi:hypothetical protein
VAPAIGFIGATITAMVSRQRAVQSVSTGGRRAFIIAAATLQPRAESLMVDATKAQNGPVVSILFVPMFFRALIPILCPP